MTPPRRGLLLGGLALLALLGGTGALLSGRISASRARNELLAAMSADLRAEAASIDAGPVPPDAENAAIAYEAAFALLVREGERLVPKLDRPWDAVPPDLAKWVDANAAALAAAEPGAALDACRFPFAAGQGLREWPYGPEPQMEGMPRLADLFSARARIRLHEGRTAAAVADALRVPRVVRHELLRSVREPSERDAAVRRAVGVLVDALRRPDLDAATERSVVDGLLDWPQVAEGEAMQRRIGALLDEGWAIAILAGGLPAKSEGDFRRQFGLEERGLLGRASAEDCRRLAAHRERWLAVRERRKAGASPEGPPPTWIGRLGLVRVAYAARVFERLHGRPPARVEDLVPALLPAVPRDPSGKGPLRVEWPPRLEWADR